MAVAPPLALSTYVGKSLHINRLQIGLGWQNDIDIRVKKGEYGIRRSEGGLLTIPFWRVLVFRSERGSVDPCSESGAIGCFAMLLICAERFRKLEEARRQAGGDILLLVQFGAMYNDPMLEAIGTRIPPGDPLMVSDYPKAVVFESANDNAIAKCKR